MIRYDQEDEADKWLREHDPYYTSTKKNKTSLVRFPYDTLEMRHRKANMEIPISNLNKSQLVQFSEVAGPYDEDGNFDL